MKKTPAIDIWSYSIITRPRGLEGDPGTIYQRVRFKYKYWNFVDKSRWTYVQSYMKQECEEVEYLVIYLLLLSYAKMVKILVFYGEEFSKKN